MKKPYESPSLKTVRVESENNINTSSAYMNFLLKENEEKSGISWSNIQKF